MLDPTFLLVLIDIMPSFCHRQIVSAVLTTSCEGCGRKRKERENNAGLDAGSGLDTLEYFRRTPPVHDARRM